MTEQIPDEPDEPDEQFHRDRREHGGEIDRLDEDRLARLTEEERVEAGVDDVAGQGHLRGALPPDVPGDRHHRSVAEPAARELGPLSERDPYPPSHYDRS